MRLRLKVGEMRQGAPWRVSDVVAVVPAQRALTRGKVGYPALTRRLSPQLSEFVFQYRDLIAGTRVSSLRLIGIELEAVQLGLERLCGLPAGSLFQYRLPAFD